MGLRNLLKGDHIDYSGRGMYGKRCDGFVYDSQPEATADLVDAALDADTDEDRDLLRKAKRVIRFDSMGLGAVVYFPGMKSDDSEDIDGDEDDD